MASEKRPLTPDETAFIREMNRAATAGALYEVLGVHGGTTAAEVEAAYMEIARKWHPDRFYSRDAGPLASVIDENFAVATRAYRTLRDAGKRAVYDRELASEGKTPPLPPAGWERTSPTSGERPLGGSPRTSGERAVPPPPAAPPAHETSFRPKSMPEIPKPKAKAPPAVAKHLQAILDQKRKAEAHFENAQKEFAAGQYGKAESAAYLAMTIDARNSAYKELYEKARSLARETRAKQLLQQAENAESYGKVKEAIQLLKQAVECEPPEGAPYFRLGQLLRAHDDDGRNALTNLRKAAQKEPKNATYRLALAEMYASINLTANAQREATAVLQLEPKNEGAKALLKKLK
ncbi:MAG: J domain-containing protein [Myxococcota bacterium]